MNENKRSGSGGRKCIMCVDKNCPHLIFIHLRKDIVRNIPDFKAEIHDRFGGAVTNTGASDGLITTSELKA